METKDWLLFAGPLIGLIVGGIVASIVKWNEFNRQTAREDKSLLRGGLDELHLGIYDFMASCDRFYTRVVGVAAVPPRPEDVYKMVEELQAIIDEPLPRLKSMQQRYADEFGQSWADVLNATMTFKLSVEAVFRRQKTFGDLNTLNNTVKQKCQTFLFRVKEKLDGL